MPRPKVNDPKRPACPRCGPENVVRNGIAYKCKKCHAVFGMPGKRRGDRSTFTRAGNELEVEARIPRIMTDKELLAFLQVDAEVWKIDKVIYGKSEAYRKDRQVDWDVTNGTVTHGRVRDSGKLLIEPLFSVKVFLSRKVHEIEARDRIAEAIKELKRAAPKYPKIRYPKLKDGMLYEVEMPDLHLGLLAWREESGKDADLKLTVAAANRAVDSLLGFTHGLPIERIVMPVGNDFFNVNDKAEETVHGTRQQEDGRWQKTFRIGERLMISMIEKCMTIAPLDIIIIAGNHDEERMFYFGEYLAGRFHRSANIAIDNRPIKRKYYAWQTVLLGLTHGYYEKIQQLAALMPYEVPDLWAASRHREWHLGDKHHKVEMVTKTEEMENGVVVRILRSLSAPSTWSFDKGFVGAQRSAEAFLWHPQNGLCGQFTSPPE
jgi:hypothetical protein